MRFKRLPDGYIRIKTWFALWPVSIKDETRWLELVTVEYRFYRYKSSNGGVWIKEAFVD